MVALVISSIGLVLGGELGWLDFTTSSLAGQTILQSQSPATNDWPMYGGTPQRNLVNLREKNLPTTWNSQESKRKNVKWIARLGSRAYGCPVIAGGKVFIGTNNENPQNPAILGDRGIMACFREADGKFLWQAVHDKLPSGMVNDWPREGIPSMPVVEGNRLYYVSNRCELICADTEGFLDGRNDGVQDERYQGPTDADIIWRLDMMKELNVFPHNLAICSPLLVGDLVFIITGNGVDEGHAHLPSPEAPSFLAVNKRTGRVVWQDNSPTRRMLDLPLKDRHDGAIFLQMVDRGEIVQHGQWSSPTFANVDGRAQVIFPGGDGWLRALEPETGKLIWKFDGNPKAAKFILGGRGTRNDFIAAPVVHENRLYIGVGQDPEHGEGVGHLWCIDLTRAVALGGRNKDHDVSSVNDQFDPKAPENKDSALAWHFGGMLDAKQVKAAERAWREDKLVWATKLVAALVANRPLDLGMLDAFPQEPRDFAFGRTLSNCAIHDGLVYAAELGGYLHCLDARTGAKYWTYDIKSGVWGSPFVADGKVYIGTEDGDVHVLEDNWTKRLLSVVEVLHGIKGTPVAANGVLFLATEGFLMALWQEGP
jgi:outer membrane protein assembly factor BamB